MQDNNFKPTQNGVETNIDKLYEELTVKDKIEYIHRITMSVVKGSKADKIFKRHYKSKEKIFSGLNTGKIILPVNNTDQIKINITEMIKSDTYNTYVISVTSYAGSETYKYMERISCEL